MCTCVAGGSFEVTLRNFTRQQLPGNKANRWDTNGDRKAADDVYWNHLRRQENPGNKGKDTFRETNA